MSYRSVHEQNVLVQLWYAVRKAKCVICQEGDPWNKEVESLKLSCIDLWTNRALIPPLTPPLFFVSKILRGDLTASVGSEDAHTHSIHTHTHTHEQWAVVTAATVEQFGIRRLAQGHKQWNHCSSFFIMHISPCLSRWWNRQPFTTNPLPF